jgi:putative hemolysin
LALVIDERGHIEGLVTLTDVLEALVGEVPDEDEADEEAIVRREDGSWLVDGLLAAEELKERLGSSGLPLHDEEADYQTVGGMVMDVLGRVPFAGDRFEWEAYSFEVLDMDGRRVDKVLVTPLRGAVEGDAT